MKIGSKIEYILMGIFNIDDIDKTDYTTKITAYSNMINFETDYFSELGDKPTLQQVVNELSSKTGVEFTGSLPAYTVSWMAFLVERFYLSCQVDENNILSKGSTGTDSMELRFENPWITEVILNNIYNKLNGVSYLGYSMKWQGDLSLDP